MNTSLKARKAFADASFDFGLEGRFHLDNLSSTPVTEADHALPGDGSIDQIMRNASANFGFSEYINDRDARYMNTAASFQVANDALPVHANDIGWRFDERPPVQNLAPASLGIADTFGVPVATATVAATGDHNIDGVLSGVRWASTAVTFSFTNSISDYELGYEDRALHAASYQVMNATQQAVARAWIGTGGEYYDVSLLAPSELTGANDREATIRMAVSDVPGTAFAYYPNSSYVEGGDAWFNGSDYNSPVIGNYAYHTFGHELGHALGLKHGHETGGPANLAMNTDRDSMEFSIMTYRSYVGHDLNALPYYTNETGGFAQSLMMYDIAAIQHMYGAWFGNNSGNTAYTFSTTTGEMFVDGVGQGTPVANRIFRTIWDGGGIDTYNFSNYTTSLSIDLTPGGWSDVDTAGNFQSAKLNNGNGGITQYARGQVFNALQYQGDVRSLIENAVGGTGNDIIKGNAANNTLNGGNGNDTINAGSGTDTTTGGAGDDWLIEDDYINFDSHDGGDGVDTIDYSSVTFNAGAVTINLSTGISSVIGGNTETISNFENVWGSQGGETIVGSSGNNALDGKGGNDTLSGGFGNDTVLGDDGDDTLYGNQDNDSLSGGVGNDWMHGGAGNDSLDGGLGNDTLAGGVGNDTQAGGDGLDTADYSASTDAVTVNLIAAGSQFVSVSQGTDVLSGIENLLGGGYNDLLTGDNAANLLSGLGGNDTVNGGYGNDTVLGGDGDDTLYGNQDNDSLSGGLGNDWMHGGAGNDSLDGGSANDIVNGGLGIDLLSGGTGSDIFRFDTALGFGNIDTITDFQSGDLLSLSASIFTAFSGGTVVLGENLAYEAATGAVSYDADGAAAGAAQIFAIIGIGSHPGTLINTDFVLS